MYDNPGFTDISTVFTVSEGAVTREPRREAVSAGCRRYGQVDNFRMPEDPTGTLMRRKFAWPRKHCFVRIHIFRTHSYLGWAYNPVTRCSQRTFSSG